MRINLTVDARKLRHDEYMREYRQRPEKKARANELTKERRKDPVKRKLINEAQKAAYQTRPDVRQRSLESARRSRKRPGVLETERERGRARRIANPGEKDCYRLRYRYGITESDRNAMEVEQHGRCAACGGPPTRGRLVIDHCHATGKVRGLLCHHCNVSMGIVGDSIERLQKLIDYLRSSS